MQGSIGTNVGIVFVNIVNSKEKGISVNTPLIDRIRNSLDSNDTILGKFRSLLSNGYYEKAYVPTDDDLKLLKKIQEFVSNNGGSEKGTIKSSINIEDNEVIKGFIEDLADSVEIADVSEESLKRWGNTAGKLSEKVTVADLAVKGFNVALNALGGLAVSIALQLIVEGFQKIINAQSDAVNAANKTADALKNTLQGYSDNMSALSGFEDRLSTLAKGVDSVGNNISLTNEQYNEYKDIISQVSDIMPNLTTYFNDQGEAIGFVGVQLDELSGKYREVIQNEANEFWSNANDSEGGAQSLFKGYQAQRQWGTLSELGARLEEYFGNGVDINQVPARLLTQAVDNLLSMSQDELASVVHTEFGEGNSAMDNLAEAAIFNALDITSADVEQMTEAEFNSLREQIAQQGVNARSTLDASAEQIRMALSEAYNANEDFYTQLTEEEQSLARNFLSSLSSDFLMGSDETGIMFNSIESQREFADRIVEALENNTDGFKDALQSLLAIDPSTLSVADYQEQAEQYIDSIANALDWSSEQTRIGLKLSFGLDFDNAERDEQIKQIGDRIGASVDEIKARFSETEISVLISPDFQFAATDIDELKAEIQASAEVSEALSNMESTGDSLRTSLNSVTAALENYALISDVVNGKVYLTEEQMLSLVRAMPELQQYLQRTSQGWILEEGAMDAVNSAVGSLEDSYVSAQLAMSRVVAQQAAQRLGITENEFSQIQSLAGAYMALSAEMGGLTLTLNSDGTFDTSSLPKDAQVVLSYSSNLETLNKAKDTLDQTSLFDGEAEKAAKEQAEALEDYNEAIADAAKNYQETVKDAEERYNETLKDLDEEQYNADFKYQIDSITESLQAYADQLDILSESLDGYYKTDIVGKMSNITEQYQLQAQYSGELKAQMDQLLNTVPESAEAWQELASTLETVSSDYFESQRNLIELRKQIYETAAETITAAADMSSSAIDDVSDNLDRINDIMENGSFAYTLYDLPRVRTMDPEAVRNQRKENKMLEDEEQEYQEKVTEIRKRAVDEQKAYEDQERQEQREEALAEYNEALADAKEQYDEALANAQESYESAMESASGRVAATNTSNMINSTSAWVADATNQYEQLKQAFESNGIDITATINLKRNEPKGIP